MSLKSPRRLLTSLSIAAVLFTGGFFIQETFREYDRELSVLQRTLKSQATVLAEHAQLTFSMANRVLEDIQWENSHEQIQMYLASRSLYQRILNTPQFAGLILTDVEGNPLFTVKRAAMVFDNLAEQPFFKKHREGADFILGAPFPAGEFRRLVPVSQRLLNKEGRFSGVAVVLLDMTYFQNFYTQISNSPNLRIGMYRRDGTALSLYPATDALQATELDAFSVRLAGHHGETLIHDSLLDGTHRITAYRNLALSPVAVTVSYSYTTFLAGLYPSFVRNGLLFLLIATGIGASMVMIHRAMREAYRAREAQLGFQRQQQETLRLCHAIARNLPNGRVFVLDETLRYVFVEGNTWQDSSELQPQKLIGKTIQQAYPDGVSRSLEALVRSALAGTAADSEVAFHGRAYKAFATPLPDDDGTIRRCLLLSQDITQFKENQLALEELNSELHRLASCDGLLGIANRREFERVLELEWMRGLREGQPLSLLLIDVDHFKKYNDNYGHPEGDVCLQQIALLLSEALKRPADLVARYGGEEMAVLLPNTSREGALHIAERVHALLAKHHLCFEASPTSDRVTVSIGIATYIPASTSSPSMLVENADAALYAAKGNGRNRTEVYEVDPIHLTT